MPEVADTFRATLQRIVGRLDATPGETTAVVEDEFRGLYHGMLVIFDGGTALALKQVKKTG
jgi:hypothetical protein